MNVFGIVTLFIASAVAAPNAYYGSAKPDIRIESYAPAVVADPPMNYGYHHAPHTKTVVVVADPPKHTEYSYSAPADVPRSNDYGYAHATVKAVPSIVRQVLRTDNYGTYTMNVESSDGTSQVESGSLKHLGHPEGPASVKSGSYAWTSPEGQRFRVDYTADENGFVAKGDHLPTPPPIPEEIRQSLAIPRVHNHAYTHSYGYSAPAVVVADAPIKSYY